MRSRKPSAKITFLDVAIWTTIAALLCVIAAACSEMFADAMDREATARAEQLTQSGIVMENMVRR